MTDRPTPDAIPVRAYHPPAGGPRVVHEDLYEVEGERGGFVVVDKPAGLLAVPGVGPDKADCARSRIRDIYPWATGPMTVHRLDMATSGLLVLALDASTHRHLSLQFERRRARKRYLALVEGHPAGDEGLIEVPMRKDLERSPAQLADWLDGKASTTRWRVLARESHDGSPAARVELEPATGRTHQLRVHCAHPRVRTLGSPPAGHPLDRHGLGAPILGDELYGGRPAPRLMLHAWALTFHHPRTGNAMSVSSPAPF